MRRAILNVVTIALAAATAHGQWTTEPVSAPRVQYQTFASSAAGTTVSFHVYLPQAYDQQPNARFPVLYWLHGSGNPIAGIPWLSNFFATAMGQGRIPPMLVVFPNGMNYSMWCDSKDGDVPMERVVLDDLIPPCGCHLPHRCAAQRCGRWHPHGG